MKLSKEKKKYHIIDAPRKFETVGEAVRYEILCEMKDIMINEIADACIKDESTKRLTRIYNLIETKLL